MQNEIMVTQMKKANLQLGDQHNETEQTLLTFSVFE